MKITMTNGSKAKGWTGSRIRITASDGILLDQINLPAGNPRRYLESKAGAKYRRTVHVACMAAAHYEGNIARRQHKSSPRCANLAELFARGKARITAMRALNGLGKPAWEQQAESRKES